jgi:PAS domain S-box-containing protein
MKSLFRFASPVLSRSTLHTLKAYTPAFLVLMAGIAVSWIAFSAISRSERRILEEDFGHVAKNRCTAISDSLKHGEMILQTIRRFVQSVDGMELNKLDRFVEPHFRGAFGLRAVICASWIPDADRGDWESATRLAIAGDCTISRLDQHGRTILSPRCSDYYPIRQIACSDSTKLRLGLDLGSISPLRRLCETVRERGDTVGAVLTQNEWVGGSSPRYFLATPLFADHSVAATAKGKVHRDFRGIVIAVFDLREMIENALAPLQPRGMNIELQETPVAGNRRTFYFHASRQQSPQALDLAKTTASRSPALRFDEKIHATGQSWHVVCKPSGQFHSERATSHAWSTLLAGVSVSLLLAVLLGTTVGRAARIQRLVDDRTRELRYSQERFNMALVSASQIAWDLDLENGTVLFLPQTGSILGYECSDIGAAMDTWKAKIHPNDRDRLVAAIREHLEGRSPSVCEECRMVDKTGKWRWMAVRGKVVVWNRSGQPLRVAGTTCDIHEQKLAEEERVYYTEALRSANRTLEEFSRAADNANRAKSEFVANMSHEIRTPMTAILGFTDILLGTLHDAEAIGAAEVIKRNGEYLLEIINDILDLSKIEAGKMEVHLAPCSPSEVLCEVASLMQVRADARNLTLNFSSDGPLPQLISTDPLRLRQILINLIGNALKFTEKGGVRVVTRVLAAETASPRLQIDVIDTGIGMTPDQMARLFKPFEQGDSTASRRFGGTGLGLAISRRLAEMLGGGITLSSQLGVGSAFQVTIATGLLDGISQSVDLAAAISQHAGSPRQAKEPTIRLDCRVLLVEDGPDNQRLIAHLLKKAGAEVAIAQNGVEAIERMTASMSENAKDGRAFDVVLMDVQMPRMDGYEATRILRQQGCSTPIIALTANAMRDDQAKCLEAGCDHYLSKPIDRAQLLSAIHEQLQRTSPSSRLTDGLAAADA